MIHNAEIHIFRADPNKHDGQEGFLFAVDRERHLRVRSTRVYASRAQAAMAAGLWLDALEVELKVSAQ